jgi:hypothetical protein
MYTKLICLGNIHTIQKHLSQVIRTSYPEYFKSVFLISNSFNIKLQFDYLVQYLNRTDMSVGGCQMYHTRSSLIH